VAAIVQLTKPKGAIMKEYLTMEAPNGETDLDKKPKHKVPATIQLTKKVGMVMELDVRRTEAANMQTDLYGVAMKPKSQQITLMEVTKKEGVVLQT